MEIIKESLLASLSTIGFAILFSSPKKSIIYAGFTGGLGWLMFSLVTNVFGNVIISSFLGAITVGILGEYFARYTKKPATLYVTPGIIPLVPGAGMYYTMLSLIENDYGKAISRGTETFFIALSIAIGIIISSAFSKSIRRFKSKD